MALGGATVEELGAGGQTPSLFVANNIGVALAIPAAVTTQLIVFRQRPGWLFSVRGRLRWRLLGELLLIATVIHLVVLVVWLGVVGPPEELRIRSDTWVLLAAVVLTTPLQAAGEEVTFRGLATRCIGSWFDDRRLGLVVATATTAAVFVLLLGFAAADVPEHAAWQAVAQVAAIVATGAACAWHIRRAGISPAARPETTVG